MKVRRAEFAGSWYPGTRVECIRSIQGLEQECAPCPQADGRPVAGLVPHAGWYYSGRLACNVIQCLAKSNSPDVCIIFGRHLPPTEQAYIMTLGAWATPLGDLEIDEKVAQRIATEYDFVIEDAVSHEPDNTIELQLPFIKYFFPNTKIVPIGLPPKQFTLEVARRTVEICHELGRNTVVVGSTDLTHYGYSYGFVPKGSGPGAVTWVKEENDRMLIQQILKLDSGAVIKEALDHHNACCPGAVAATIEAAKALRATEAREVGYYTSYDVRPDTNFVGYVGILFYA